MRTWSAGLAVRGTRCFSQKPACGTQSAARRCLWPICSACCRHRRLRDATVTVVSKRRRGAALGCQQQHGYTSVPNSGLFSNMPFRPTLPAALRRLPARLRSMLSPWLLSANTPVTALIGPPENEPMVTLAHAPRLQLLVVPGDLVSNALLTSGVWEPELSAALLADATRGGLLVEVGANLGYFSLLWAEAAPDNRVIAFEPAPRNLGLMRRSIALNNLGDRIRLLPVGAGPSLALMSFDLGPPEQTGWGGVVRDPAHAVQPADIVTVPLDALLANVPRVEVLKIDVEGFDTEVLDGCQTLLRERRIGRVYYEQNHPRMAAIGVARGRAAAILAASGYRTWRMGDAGEVEEWVAEPDCTS